VHQTAYWKQRENAVNVFSLSISRDTLSRSRTGGQSNLPKTSHQNHDQNYSYKVLDLSCDNCTTCWRLFFASRSISLFMRFLCSPPRISICATYFTTPVCHLTCPHPSGSVCIHNAGTNTWRKCKCTNSRMSIRKNSAVLHALYGSPAAILPCVILPQPCT